MRTYRHSRGSGRQYRHTDYTPRHRNRRLAGQDFKCKHCRRFIGPPPSGGYHRNHCPFCLYSCHVDDQHSGDRMSTCGAKMQPIGTFQRAKGEYVLVHRCLGCGFERFNRIAADDDFELVLSLPTLPPRSKHEEKMQRLQMLLENQSEYYIHEEDEDAIDLY
ncbi:RNHCP domain-containing protein [Ktedonosporobacter rubrisoli]|uniref:RNHCP domain-containing protein n=1 Tax=Ktedonosporobacter rubrisoli TaxID=2509675 RepID=UPI0013EEDA22|nr:RNHCP domain-containing protein [Ktedonosporobacter rubrisoli]